MRELLSVIVQPLFICLVVFMAVLTAGNSLLVIVPNAKYLFGFSASPKDLRVMVFGAEERPDGELSFGVATLLELGAKPAATVKRLDVPSTLDDFTAPVWKSTGTTAYFLASTGLYALDIASSTTNLVYSGSLAGLAISQDDSTLVFWNLAPKEKGHFSLVVFDLKPLKPVRTWTLQTQYGADPYGFELAFSADALSVYARTYDMKGATPLKEFVIETGAIRLLEKNCSSLAKSPNSVYFIAMRNEKRSLVTIEKGKPEEVMPDFAYDSLLSSGSRRWIVAQDGSTGNLAVFDTKAGTLREYGRGCDMATVLHTGQVIFAHGGRVVSSQEDCNASNRRP